jgi:cephalosporin-C deacetylase-like acetyl esterase
MHNPYFPYKEYKAKNATRTLFFFPAGFAKLSLYRYTIYQLNRMGITVVGFDFKWRKAVREVDLEGLHTTMRQVDTVVSTHMAANPGRRYAVFGSSFGGVIALYVAKQHQNVDAVILNVPHAAVSKVLWTHKPSRPFKDSLVRQGIDTEVKLHKALGPIESQANLDLLKDRKIINFTALNDKIVPNGLELANALAKANPHAVLYQTRFCHFVGGTLGVLRKSKWDYVLKVTHDELV